MRRGGKVGVPGREIKILVKALHQAKAEPYQVKMAAILLAINGLDNALEFVRWVAAGGEKLKVIPYGPDTPDIA